MEAYAEGPRQDVEAWIAKLRQGPPLSRVESLQPQWQQPEGSTGTFTVR